MVDLLAVWEMLCRRDQCAPIGPLDEPAIQAKQEKVEHFLDYVRSECGTLTEDRP